MSAAAFDLWQKALAVASDHGFPLPQAPNSIGNWHRVPGINKQADNKAAAYKCLENCVHLVDHASGFSTTVFPDKGTVASARFDDKRIRQIAEEQQRQVAERNAKYQRVAKQAQSIWSRASKKGTHPYIERKGLSGLHNARIEHGIGSLLIPVWVHGQGLVNLQRITADGTKRPLKGGRVRGAYSLIGSLEDANRVLVCEGWATGATLWELHALPVIVAFNAGNLMSVCGTVRELLPEAQIIIAADNDRQTQGNPGLTKAIDAAKVVDGQIAQPKLCKCCKCTDHNDAAVCARRRSHG